VTSHLRSLQLDSRGLMLFATVVPDDKLLAAFFESSLDGIDALYDEMRAALASAMMHGTEDTFSTNGFAVDIGPEVVTLRPQFNAPALTLSLVDFADSLDTYASYFDGRRELRREAE
jgi:hypothetical protein